jgi:hypothetical protein
LVILSLFSNHKRSGNIRVLLMLMIVLPLVTLILRAATFLHAAVTPSGFHFHQLLIVALFRLLPFFRLVSFVGGPGSAREDDLVDVGLNLRGEEVGESEVEGVLEGEGAGQVVGAVTLKDSDVLLLTVADVHSDRQELNHLVLIILFLSFLLF